jgi:hypothetical protein
MDFWERHLNEMYGLLGAPPQRNGRAAVTIGHFSRLEDWQWNENALYVTYTRYYCTGWKNAL